MSSARGLPVFARPKARERPRGKGEERKNCEGRTLTLEQVPVVIQRSQRLIGLLFEVEHSAGRLPPRFLTAPLRQQCRHPVEFDGAPLSSALLPFFFLASHSLARVYSPGTRSDRFEFVAPRSLRPVSATPIGPPETLHDQRKETLSGREANDDFPPAP